jgi:hypothetical protein
MPAATIPAGVISFFMALPSFHGVVTPSLQAQGGQRRPPYFNRARDIPELDVVAVYTAADPSTGHVTTLHTDRVSPHCPIRTEKLPQQTIFFVPPKEGGGDAEYAGHGPCVDFRLAVRTVNGDKTLMAKYQMHAFECDDDFGKPRADFTSARGEGETVLKVASPLGRIVSYGADPNMSFQYIDKTTSDDTFEFTNTPAPSLRFVGDTDGSNDAGTRTGVFITLREATIQLETCAPASGPPP